MTMNNDLTERIIDALLGVSLRSNAVPTGRAADSAENLLCAEQKVPAVTVLRGSPQTEFVLAGRDYGSRESSLKCSVECSLARSLTTDNLCFPSWNFPPDTGNSVVSASRILLIP